VPQTNIGLMLRSIELVNSYSWSRVHEFNGTQHKVPTAAPWRWKCKQFEKCSISQWWTFVELGQYLGWPL